MSKQTPIYVGEGILAQIKDVYHYHYTQEDMEEVLENLEKAQAELLAFFHRWADEEEEHIMELIERDNDY